MKELFHGQRIYRDSDTGKEVIQPISFKYDDILDLKGGKGVALDFQDSRPKTFVQLTQSRCYWLLAPLSKIRAEWEAYLSGVPEWDMQFSAS